MSIIISVRIDTLRSYSGAGIRPTGRGLAGNTMAETKAVAEAVGKLERPAGTFVVSWSARGSGIRG